MGKVTGDTRPIIGYLVFVLVCALLSLVVAR